MSIGINKGLEFGYEANPTFASWVRAHSYFAENATMILRGCLWLLAAYISSCDRSFRLFIRNAGFQKRPSLSGWLLALTAIALGLIDLFLIHNQRTSANQSAPTFYQGGEATWTFFVVYTIMLAPFFEETVMRGFLFRAFRHAYGVTTAIVLVLCVQLYFHWGLVSHDLIASILLVTGGIVLCLIREHTGSTWNCVLFHSAYNATVIRDWPVSIMGMALMLFLCQRATTSFNSEKADL